MPVASDSALYSRLAAPNPDPASLAAALCTLGDLHRERGETDAARAAYDAAASLAPSGRTSLGRGLVALMAGEPGAREIFLRARDALAAEGEPKLAATAEANAAAVDLGDGDLAGATAGFHRALDRLAAAGLAPDPFLHCNLARCLMKQGLDPRDQLSLARAAAGGVEGLVWMLEGELHRDAGRLDEAAGALEAALARLTGPGERLRVLLALGGVRNVQGDVPAAAALLDAALPTLRAAGQPEPLADTLAALGGLHYLRKDPARAVALLDEADAIFPADLLGSPLETRLRTNRGLALVAVARLDEATAELERAIATARARGDHAAVAAPLNALVDLHRYRGDLSAAIHAQTAASALTREHGAVASETGLLYTPVEDRSLNISTASLRRRGHGPRRGPVLFLCPPAHGATGPLFPRGAVEAASFLQANGIPARVLPLAHVADPFDPPGAKLRIDAAVRDAIDTLRPRAVGISVTFSYLYPQGRDLAATVRAHDPGVPIVIGGPHVTYQDRESLAETPAIDVVVRGEGEWTALELFAALEAGADLGGVLGITWRAPDGTIHRNAQRPLGSVIELPPADFSLLPAAFCHRMDTSALTSRGCSFRCKFCHEFRYWGGVVREFPVERILDEMQRLSVHDNQLHGIDDSMLDMRTPYFLDLVARLGRSPHVSPNFGLLTRLDTITAEGSRAMAAAGLRWVCVGAESGSQVVLDAMNKGLKVAQTAEGLELARDAGLSTSSFLIIGHPGDNPVESEVTLGFVEELFSRDLLSWLDLSTFTPYPGTPFFATPARYGVEILLRDWNLWRRTNRPVAQLADYSAGDIYLNLLRTLAVQQRHLGAGSGSTASG